MYLLMNKDRGGSSGARNAGLEPYCEILGAELAGKLLSEAVSYALINMHGRTGIKMQAFYERAIWICPCCPF